MKAPRRAALGASRIGAPATLRMLALSLAAALFATAAMAFAG